MIDFPMRYPICGVCGNVPRSEWENYLSQYTFTIGGKTYTENEAVPVNNPPLLCDGQGDCIYSRCPRCRTLTQMKRHTEQDCGVLQHL